MQLEMAELEDCLYGMASAVLEDGVTRLGALYGLSPVAARIYAAALLSLDGASEPELSRWTGFAEAGVTAALRRLERAGLVVRRDDRYDAVLEPWTGLVAWRRLRVTREVAALREISDFLDRTMTAAGRTSSEELRAQIARVQTLSAGFDPIRTEARTDRRPTRSACRSTSARRRKAATRVT